MDQPAQSEDLGRTKMSAEKIENIQTVDGTIGIGTTFNYSPPHTDYTAGSKIVGEQELNGFEYWIVSTSKPYIGEIKIFIPKARIKL
jgi:hypothetical protein